MKIIATLLTGAIIMLSACTDASITKYADTKPVIRFDQFFNGPVKGYGVIYGRNGEVKDRFTVDMKGQWNADNTGTLAEDFVYFSGRKQQRTWNLVKTGDNSFTGTAYDIVGTAKGSSAGSATHWQYVMTVPVGNHNIALAFDDWMYLMDEKTIMNRVDMKKFGIRVGEVNVVMIKQ